MKIEYELIRSLFKAKNFNVVTDKKIKEDSFTDDQCKKAYKFMFEHWSKYGKFPSKKTFYTKFDIFKGIKVKEPIAYYCDEVRKNIKYNKLSAGLGAVTKIMDTDLDSACDKINKLVLELSDFNSSKTIRLIRDRLMALREYNEAKTLGGLTGYKSGWDWLDKELGGFHKEDLITVVARQKTGKTWLLCILAAEMLQMGYNILFVSMEMPPKFIRRRIMGYLFKLPYEHFRRGLLTNEEYKRFKKGIKVMKGLDEELTIINDVHDIGSLVSRCKQYNPTVVFVDGIYLMNAGKGLKDHERVQEISRGLKHAAQILDVPVIASTQLNRAAVGSKLPELHHISFSDAIGADSDVVIAAYADEAMKEKKRMLIRLLGSRESPVISRGMHWDMEKMDFKPLTREETNALFFAIKKGAYKKEDSDGEEFFDS